MDLKILGRMVLDLINILGFYTYENKLIRVKRVIGRVKRVDNDKPLGRLLRDTLGEFLGLKWVS